MDATDHPQVWTLNETECWHLLARGELGRLAVVDGGKPDLFPLNYVVDGPRIFFRTAPGSKLSTVAEHPEVAFEVDEYDESSAASVVVKGVAQRLTVQRDIDAAEDLGLRPWIPTQKYRWVRIVAASITGRRFARTSEPARYSASSTRP